MKNRVLILLFSLSFSSYAFQYGLAKNLSEITDTDTLCKVWVWFTDKKNTSHNTSLCERSLQRREMAHFRSDETDYPVSDVYIKKIEYYGARLRHEFKWENCASFIVHASKLNEIASLPFVKRVSSVNSFSRNTDSFQLNMLRKTAQDPLSYGCSYHHLEQINVPAAHEYLKIKRGFKAPGEGVIIAFFDTGFRLDHVSLKRAARSQIKAVYDFIDNDRIVSDPDSVKNDSLHPFYQNDFHGSMTLGLVAGYDPGNFMGVAWGAKFLLARTENTYWDSTRKIETEIHSEEDDWAAAVVWAESLGADIVSSSLGYRDGFMDSVVLQNESGKRGIIDYEYSDLDGKTTIVSMAALAAVKRGMIIVNSVGNEGSDKAGTLCAPADVDGVIAVGALDYDGKTIASFSSTGPTSDGRIKPDCVAPGVDVALPDLEGNMSKYKKANGTSFSTPLVAGICALIMQSMRADNSSAVCNALLSSCKYLPGQNVKNNIYGNGLPDALKACTTVAPPVIEPVSLNVFPNYIKHGEPRKISIELDNADKNSNADIRILSADGALVWKSLPVENGKKIILTSWQCINHAGKNVVPGLYYVIAEYKGKIFREKILISG